MHFPPCGVALVSYDDARTFRATTLAIRVMDRPASRARNQVLVAEVEVRSLLASDPFLSPHLGFVSHRELRRPF